MRPRPRPADEAGIAAAVDALLRGRLILHPTETVVSLSGDPSADAAVDAARRLKGYAEPRPFLCLVSDAAAARALCADWPTAAERLAAAFWPGPLTLVLPASAGAPPAVAAEGSIAVRPAVDPVSSAILSAWRRPLFSTSANRRGGEPPTDVRTALHALAGGGSGERPSDIGAIEVVLEPLAPLPVAGKPSTIVAVGAGSPRLVRDGAIPAARIREIVGDLVEAPA